MSAIRDKTETDRRNDLESVKARLLPRSKATGGWLVTNVSSVHVNQFAFVSTSAAVTTGPARHGIPNARESIHLAKSCVL